MDSITFPDMTITKLCVNGSESLTHCWVPSVDGLILEHIGDDGPEPCRSVRGAKRVIARYLDVHPKMINPFVKVIR